ncbi:MAG: 3'-5' exonuclease domain-containing protein 2 [Kiritimatiellaceae bacterium]|nr:MAG: 3'-5' exonuclease domain-containing protein 2 [Kiritimatiellaceae bacterium]|tara:strand:+ start:4951 stop:5574 length:624 start_codon:yes stop_codon:yes gene_type:complete
MTLYPDKKSISKAEINELPMQAYEGPIVNCTTPEQAEEAAQELLQETLLGFDTETRPSFRKGEHYLPALLQLAAPHKVYLFQLQQCTLTPALLQLLSRPDIIKAGVALKRDVDELKQLTPFEPGGFVELATIAEAAEIKNLGLRALTALLFGFRISKKEQVSNWAKKILSDAQKKYAATDAWLGRNLYLAFKEKGLIHSSAPSSPPD